MHAARRVAFVLVLLAVPVSAWARSGQGRETQSPVVVADINRLDSTASDIERQATALRRTDATLAADVTRALAELRDEVTYLRVKLRRDGSVTRAEYTDVRDRLETLRVKATGSPAQPGAGQRLSVQPGTPPVGPPVERTIVVPVGTELDVRLQTPLNSGIVKNEQRFEATTILDVVQGGDVAIPAGAVVRGFVSSVRAAGKIDRQGSLTLSFDEILIDAHASRLRASVIKALDPKATEDITRIGVGAGVGAVLGGLLGGRKGALLGVMIGGGGTIASTEGANVDLPAGNVLRIRLDQPLEVIR